jgi:uncharacterized membrane protein
VTAARRIGGAALVGVVCGMRTFTGPAALAVRGRVGRGRARAVLVAAAAGEAVGDKTPVVPSRTSPPPLAGRIVSGALSGGALAGVPGAAAGAFGAAGGAFGGQRARSGLGRLTGLPDALLAVVEDGAAVAAAALATRDPRAPDPDSLPARAGLGAARGAVAGVAATAVMTAAQLALQKATRASSSRTPEPAVRTVIRRLFGTDVPRDRRDALNEAAHWLYGTGWGVGLGVTSAARGRRPRVTTAGAGLALVAWGASLVELPVLRVAAPAWEQPPASVASDAGLHLLYALTAAAVLDVLP